MMEITEFIAAVETLPPNVPRLTEQQMIDVWRRNWLPTWIRPIDDRNDMAHSDVVWRSVIDQYYRYELDAVPAELLAKLCRKFARPEDMSGDLRVRRHRRELDRSYREKHKTNHVGSNQGRKGSAAKVDEPAPKEVAEPKEQRRKVRVVDWASDRFGIDLRTEDPTLDQLSLEGVLLFWLEHWLPQGVRGPVVDDPSWGRRFINAADSAGLTEVGGPAIRNAIRQTPQLHRIVGLAHEPQVLLTVTADVLEWFPCESTCHLWDGRCSCAAEQGDPRQLSG